ncbi:Ataxin-3 [Physocladia obscura]|uniref:ubiquitinyl hydrolase 1 n=1 Tax=Physocladia obscura TaxID=109957 RepID=A0AAD5XK42_9FUNG|nr:Ataxin-3 [Physocladia obscura]
MDLVELGLVFFEKQEGQLCAQHALNAILQGPYFSAVDLSQIARDLDQSELDAFADGATTPDSSNQREKFESQNYDDSGFFSIQVLEKALSVWNLSLSHITSPANAAAQQDPASQSAFILNLNEHWLALRRFGQSRDRWYNLDSTANGPKYVSEFYLQALLSQLAQEGYSIFVVTGDLPPSDADSYANSCPIPPLPKTTPTKNEQDKTKNVVAFSGTGYSLSSGNGVEVPKTNASDDSLDQDELAAAIALSLESSESAGLISPDNSKRAFRGEESEAEMIRRKRLEALDRLK